MQQRQNQSVLSQLCHRPKGTHFKAIEGLHSAHLVLGALDLRDALRVEAACETPLSTGLQAIIPRPRVLSKRQR